MYVVQGPVLGEDKTKRHNQTLEAPLTGTEILPDNERAIYVPIYEIHTETGI